jgi:hypothetical protein
MILVTIDAGWTLSAEYEVTFNASWSEATHPGAYPTNAHFSPLIGGTHNDAARFWDPGSIATLGVERMAEQGRTTPLDTEIRSAILDGTAFSLITGSGIRSPGSTSTFFQITESHPLVTLVTMIAPSPDWFVGVSGLNLREDDEWMPYVTVDLYAYDAGTDSGTDFTSADADIKPQIPISLLGNPFSDLPALGTFTFSLVPEVPGDGDYDGNGIVEQGDLDLVLLNWGTATASVPITWTTARPNGIVDQQELDAVLLKWGTTYALGAEAGVPEPSTWVLVAAVLLLFFSFRPLKAISTHF